tara:strand:- start:363 stop:635 length:273 start_codon:yes stop_codon:yes gene_type:complete
MNTRAVQLAMETYRRRAADNALLIRLLREGLQTHAEATSPERVNWDRTGDIGHVRKGLIELLMFISGRERLDIEQHLDQTRELPGTQTIT